MCVLGRKEREVMGRVVAICCLVGLARSSYGGGGKRRYLEVTAHVGLRGRGRSG